MTERRDLYKPLYPLFKVGLNVVKHRTVEGQENIPDAPAMYVANHEHVLDSPLIALTYTELTRKALRFGAKKEYFDGDGIDGHFGRTTKWLMERTGQIPVDRRDPRNNAELTRRAFTAFARGDSVALHPEGTRSPDNKLHKFHSGAARIAIAAKVPIVPVGLTYADRGRDVLIRFGEPIMPDEYGQLSYTKLGHGPKARHFTNVAEDRVAALTGKEKAGMYAAIKDALRRSEPE